jgi:inosine triphosphate pyrophosphatase
MRVVFSTGNDGKYEETCHGLCALAPSVVLTRCDVDPEEVQGSCDDIARQKTLTALRLAREQGVELSGADYFMTEDVSFHLDCLNGFPGPYVKGASWRRESCQR